MELSQIIGYLAGILTTIAVIPQIVKALRTKEVNDISPLFFSALILGLGLWTVYGFIKNDIPIILTNGISFSLNTFMLILYFRSKSKEQT